MLAFAVTAFLNERVAQQQVTTSLSLQESLSKSGSVFAQITVDPGQYGIMQWGNFRYHTYGEYYTESSSCQTSNVTYMTTYVPYNNFGGEATTNSTGYVPWPQA
jgi:predicted Zn-dependent protease